MYLSLCRNAAIFELGTIFTFFKLISFNIKHNFIDCVTSKYCNIFSTRQHICRELMCAFWAFYASVFQQAVPNFNRNFPEIFCYSIVSGAFNGKFCFKIPKLSDLYVQLLFVSCLQHTRNTAKEHKWNQNRIIAEELRVSQGMGETLNVAKIILLIASMNSVVKSVP